jgi:two-component sensor histidine kinase
LRKLFRLSAPLRHWSLLLRGGGTILLVLLAFGARYALFGATPAAPFLLFIVSIAGSAFLFGGGLGILATLVSAALTIFFFIEPIHALALLNAADIIIVVLFIAAGLLIVAMVEALQLAHAEAEGARKQAEEARLQAEARENEREMLMVELSHRVKNDLAGLSATLLMQQTKASSETAAALRSTAARLRVLSRLHDRLSRRDGHVAVDIHDFLQNLAEDIRINAGFRPVGLFVRAERHMLSLAQASPIGLIVNELITNALKHAFPGARAGTIRIAFQMAGPDYLLCIADDGTGLPDAPQEEQEQEGQPRGGIGFRLVHALAAQLGGRIETAETAQTGGTTYILRFPVKPFDCPSWRRRYNAASEDTG